MPENFYPIAGTNAEPLSFDEEIALIRRWRERRHRKSREKLVKNYLLFTMKTVKRWYVQMAEDDALLLANAAVLEAIDQFDPDRAKVGRLSNIIPFYIKVCRRKAAKSAELVKCPAKAVKADRYVSFDVDAGGDGGFAGHSSGLSRHETALGNLRPDGSFLDENFGTEDSAVDSIVSAERLDAVRASLSVLSPRQRFVVNAVYFNGLNFAETARKIKPACCRERVRQIHVEAMELLRAELKKSGVTI